MRGYAKISPQFWIGETGRELRDAGQEAMLVALYLLSNPHTNMLGLYYLPTLFIAHETGLGSEEASKGLQRAIEAGFCTYDEASEMVFIHEMARYQIADQLGPTDKQCAGIQRQYDGLPNNPFLAAFYEKYAKAFHLKTRRENRGPSEGASMPLRSQEHDLDLDLDLDLDKNPSSEQKGRSDKVSSIGKKNKYPSPEGSRLASLLKSEILRNKADYRITPRQERKWAITAERMLRLDRRTIEDIAELIRWTQRDEFWMSNVLSMDTLREKFDQLSLKAKAKTQTHLAPAQGLPADYVPASEEIKRERNVVASTPAARHRPNTCAEPLVITSWLKRFLPVGYHLPHTSPHCLPSALQYAFHKHLFLSHSQSPVSMHEESSGWANGNDKGFWASLKSTVQPFNRSTKATRCRNTSLLPRRAPGRDHQPSSELCKAFHSTVSSLSVP